jgi:coenzyme F420-reducing hydrogenase beta subunit
MINNGLEVSCFGCGVCAIVCSQEIIKIKRSNYGFFVPLISNNDLCTQCNQCNKVCACDDLFICKPLDSIEPLGYSGYSIDKTIVSSTTSGGIGMELVRIGLQNGFKIVGAKYDSDKEFVKHITLGFNDSHEELKGSKYLQSYTVQAFQSIDYNQKHIVFGTPCQIDSLRRFLRLKRYENNFVLIDLFCHGVPSYHLWNNYLNYIKKRYELLKISKVIFRDKKYGWRSYTIAFHTDKDIFYSRLDKNDLFLNFYLGNYCLNIKCYNCKFRGVNSAADIRLGDFWGTKYKKNNLGISAIIIFSHKGQNLIQEIHNFSILNREPINIILDGQLKKSIRIPKYYKKLINSLHKNYNLKTLYIRYAYLRIIKNLLPVFIKNKLKSLINK